MLKLLDANGDEAIVGKTYGYWLGGDDFVSTEEEGFDARRLGAVGFPRNWPDVYTRSAALKSLVGKRGRIAGCRVAVAGDPTLEERARLPGLNFQPLQSFANAERAAERAEGVAVVRGWAVFERLDRPSGSAFVAERYWWNALPDGTWVDLTPRPEAWPRLLLAEAAHGAPKERSLLTAFEAETAACLFEQRFGRRPVLASGPSPAPAASVPAPAPVPTSAPAAAATPALCPATAAAPAPAPAQKSKRAPAEAKPEAKPKAVSAPKRVSQPAAAPSTSPKKGLDYSKFSNIEDSDDEKLVVRQQPVRLPMGMPRDAVSREDYDRVWQMLLTEKELPFCPAPDLDVMWGYYKHGGMDEQALLDQACEYVGKFPVRLGASDWKAKTYALTKKLESSSREEEARMWSIICVLRYPRDPDAYYNQGVLLSKLCDKVKFGGAPTARLHSLDGPSKSVPSEQYCSLFSRASAAWYRRCLKVDPKQRAAYINLIGCLERNEPTGWYDEVHELAAAAVRNGIWYNVWQRSPHFVTTLTAKPWHDPRGFAMCNALEENYATIRAEYDAYIERLTNRKDWDDSDTTPGLGDVGGRAGALHDGGLAKSGRWREVPLFTNMTVQRSYAEYFPETMKILGAQCRDATGLAFCGGGDVIFSVLTPGTRLRPHCGPSNSRLTCHLGIWVPKTVQEGCYLRCAADNRRGWEEGKCIVFDDSFEHEVVYGEAKPDEPYPGDRVVLLANFWHPDFEFKNDPDWRAKSDEAMGAMDVESLPQTALANLAPAPATGAPPQVAS